MKTRSCESSQMNTGGSACKIDWGKVKGIILVKHGIKLPEDLTAEKMAELCHADRPNRIYPISPVCEYAKGGGEVQTSAVGYGPNQYNGLNAQTDTFTLLRFDEMLNAQLLKCAGKEWDAYYWDDNNMLIGYNDGTGILAGIPMSTVYPSSTPFSTSSSKSTMTVNLCHMDAEDSQMNFDYYKLDFNPTNAVKGLTEVMLVEKETGKYQIVETIGGYNRTPDLGSVIAEAASTVMDGTTSASYENGMITVVAGEGEIGLKSPSVLYENDIKWVECVKVVKASKA